MTVWERFRQWRQSRPFWGGLLTVLAGLEIIGSMNLELGGGTIAIGGEGFPAYLIAFVLIICGPLAWFMPAQRHFYGLIATFVAVYSLIGVNLGGFIAGMLLGVIGGGLIFAWNPETPSLSPASQSLSPSSESESESESEPEPEPDSGSEAGGASDAGSGSDSASAARHAATAVILLALSLGVMGAPGRANAMVGPCGTPAAASSAAPSPSPSPTRPQGPISEIIGGIFDFFGRLIGVAPTPTPSPTPTATTSPSPCPSPSPSTTGKPTATATPTPPRSSGSPSATAPPPPPKVVAEGTFVARRPGRMTGSNLTMTNLSFEGVVELPVKGQSPMRVLKFSMSQADTDNFQLQVFGDKGWDTQLRSSKLTVAGSTVFFYTSRFRANLFGAIPVDYTPDSLPPPIPLPFVFFTNADIQLVLVDSPDLLAPKLRINQVPAS